METLAPQQVAAGAQEAQALPHDPQPLSYEPQALPHDPQPES
ncbi:MAG: hypothetical protein AB7U20_10950 [Planctomycetaceae bacterium]